jgi:hypothetical protein
MKRFSGTLGVQQGTRILFSDFAHDGAMWTGSGPREVRRTEAFGEPFLAAPAVMVSVSMWDIDNKANSRIEIVCRTWSDSRIARIRADWMAIGATQDDEAWDVI